MSHAEDLRKIFAETVRLLERQEEIATELAAFREAATAKGLDWSQVKALAKARVKDEEAGDDKRVTKLVEKADFASAYADMLGLLSKDERKIETRSSSESRANARVEAAALKNPSGEAADERQPSSDGPPADRPAERASRLATGRTVAAGRDATTPAPSNTVTQSEPAAFTPLIRSGEGDRARETRLDAGSPPSDDFNEIPPELRRTPDGGFEVRAC